MPTIYRAFQLDAQGRVSRPPHVLEAVTDEQALQEAQQYLEGCDLAVWQGERRVAILEQRSMTAEAEATDVRT